MPIIEGNPFTKIKNKEIAMPPLNLNLIDLKKIIDGETNDETLKDEEEIREVNNPLLANHSNNEINDNISNKKDIYTCKDIKNILIKNEFSENITNRINEKYITKNDMENIYLFRTNIERKRRVRQITTTSEKKKGRKKNGDETSRQHTKENSDNIIKKCKSIFFTNLVEFVNKFNEGNKFKFYKLSYKDNVNNIKKDDEIIKLEMTLKEILSQKITQLKKKENEYANKKIIDILEKESKDNTINPIIKLLDMTFEEWINVFTLKNHFDFKFDGLQKTFEKILEKNNVDDKYFSRLVFYLYNYKKYFENKKGRNSKKNTKNK